jgi:hypothetical protein
MVQKGKNFQNSKIMSDPLDNVAKIAYNIAHNIVNDKGALDISPPDKVVIDFSPLHDIVVYGVQPYLCSPLHPDQRMEFWQHYAKLSKNS